MKCLLKYQWVKLPRNLLPQGKGIMGDWARLASRAAFRSGTAKYCGHSNEVDVGMWAGGTVGLKSILRQKSRTRALDTLDKLAQLGYVTYELQQETKKLTYRITDWVVEHCGTPCSSGAIYATEEYGFICLPRNITQRLVNQGYVFQEADAWLDLWCHTVYEDPCNVFSYMTPAVQLGRYGIALTLETLGQRWRWEKTKVWRFLQKHRDTFTLHKLPGAYGCLIFNTQYPTDTVIPMPTHGDVVRILSEIRIRGEKTHLAGSDNDRINRLITWYSRAVLAEKNQTSALQKPKKRPENRVALSAPIYTRAYLSQCWNCKNCINDCWVSNIAPRSYSYPNGHIRGPCTRRVPNYLIMEAT